MKKPTFAALLLISAHAAPALAADSAPETARELVSITENCTKDLAPTGVIRSIEIDFGGADGALALRTPNAADPSLLLKLEGDAIIASRGGAKVLLAHVQPEPLQTYKCTGVRGGTRLLYPLTPIVDGTLITRKTLPETCKSEFRVCGMFPPLPRPVHVCTAHHEITISDGKQTIQTRIDKEIPVGEDECADR